MTNRSTDAYTDAELVSMATACAASARTFPQRLRLIGLVRAAVVARQRGKPIPEWELFDILTQVYEARNEEYDGQSGI